ncbi:hypothetical protein VNO77_23895 [Canavalia gladiata]|uniref:Uncharacterized protein n=1 Tax=Canavalia gladiata TaxID=3824 RepID=A0AAN9QC84_CANGL
MHSKSTAVQKLELAGVGPARTTVHRQVTQILHFAPSRLASASARAFDFMFLHNFIPMPTESILFFQPTWIRLD